MDRIYLPVPTEALAPEQITLVNALRRTLMLRDEVGHANAIVTRMFANVIKSEGARDVLEWGCGYSSIEADLPPNVSLSCVDLDPQVVKWQSARGIRCHHTSQPLIRASFDAIVSIFVFHFRIADSHVRSIAGALRPTGFLLANIYRRDDASRATLRTQFERQDLTVISRDDPLGLCARHEFWAMSRTRTPNELADLLRLATHSEGA
jgi:SAM-dependent methyltransferase